MPPPPRVGPGSSAGLVRVERDDGAVFELPETTAVQLGIAQPAPARLGGPTASAPIADRSNAFAPSSPIPDVPIEQAPRMPAPPTDPRLRRVRRGDGTELTLPAEMADALGLVPADAPQPAPAPAAPPAPLAAPPVQYRRDAAAATPPAPPGAIPTDIAPDVAALLTEEGQRELGVQPRARAHTVAPDVLRRIEEGEREPSGLDQVLRPVPTPGPREGEEFVSVVPSIEGVPPMLARLPDPEPQRRRRRAPEAPRELTEEERNAQLVEDLINRPENAPPLVPEDMRRLSPLEREQQRIAEGERIAREQAHSEAVAAAERQDILDEAARQQAERERERERAFNDATRRYLAAAEEARTTRVDPTRFFADRGAAGMIGVAIATALGGLGAALTGGPNRALETIERAIERDIRAQEVNQRNAQASVSNARTFLDITRQQFADREAAEHAARSLAWSQVAERASQQAAQLRDEGARLRAQELSTEAEQRAAAAQQAAIVAAQDRELALRERVANVREAEADAARAERRASGGGGGGGRAARGLVPREIMGTPQDPVVQQAIEFLGLDPTIAAEQAANTEGGSRSGRNLLLRQIGEAQQRRGRLATGFELAPGRTLTDRQVQDVNTLINADREFNAAIATIREYAERIRSAGLLGYGWEQLRGRLGFGSRDFQTINHAIDVIRTQFRNINQSGNSLGAQEMASHDFPNLTQNLSLDAILANVEAARDIKHRYVSAVLENLGITEGGGGGHGGDAEPQQPLPPGGSRR